ncbi:tetraspanin-18-like [Haliotis rufescens]|uniref:tetraspanin-18-like n=1 Tax=Haliotis rufescens TaxID=6454 RepID=UPI001EAF9B2C|nr:tetraspanin-18-like [Haliotis rufescens]XP_046376206.1 tetraspanin-18-like [Haliotis rufescens]XP_046376207.1 tetraspanin-18-like [Haliotis rufescens]XP_046376208.1 tetraspanin-18-like [Haliotis rufescens]
MCQGLARCFLIVFNIIFLIFGVLCLGIGIWVVVDKTHVISLFRYSSDKVDDLKAYDVPSLLESGAYILIAVGALVFVISVFGFCGAIKKSRCCLITYGVLVGIILVIQVAAGIAVGVFSSQFDSFAKPFLNETMPEKYKGPYDRSDVISFALDVLQASQECCGINGPGDFVNYHNFNKTWNGAADAVIPFTCCKSTKKDSFPDSMEDYMGALVDQNCPTDVTKGYQEGCYDKLRELAQTYFAGVLGVAIGVAVLELILIIVACCIAKNDPDGKMV